MKSVLIEIAQILGSFKGKYAVIGGAVPWLLLEADDMRHVGTLHVLDPRRFRPTCVRLFVQNSQIAGDRTPEEWQQDAFGQVDAWLRHLGLRD